MELKATTFEVYVRTPRALPPGPVLLQQLRGKVPRGFKVTVVSTRGDTTDLGTIGQ